MIQKKDLKPFAYYVGRCRNTYVAQWTGEHFIHIRHKFGHAFVEEIKHPDDEQRYDVFEPLKEIEEI